MMTLSDCLFYFCLIAVVLYAFSIIRWRIGWVFYPATTNDAAALPEKKISVVLAVRNERDEILNCLHSLNAQQYKNLEIIISDDFSEDTTRELVKKFIAESASSDKVWRLLEAAKGDQFGKKAALERAIGSSTGTLIITTDADCTMGNNWVKSFAACHQKTNAAMMTGFVRLNAGKNWFEKFQGLEFISLSGTGAASVILGHPLMCNGANLAFEKAAFYKAGGYRSGGSLPSGDDTFLMLRLAKSGKANVVFNKSQEGIVTSKPAGSMNQLIAQRKRWASKTQFYSEKYIKMTGVFLVAVNTCLLLALIFGLFGSWLWSEVLLIWIIKATADFLFLYPISRFAFQQQLLLLFLPAVIMYPVYAVAGMLYAPGKVSYTWKDRVYTVSHKTHDQ